MIHFVILTISDSCHEGSRVDRSGPALSARAEQLGWQSLGVEILPDDRERIAARLQELSRSGTTDLILTTGGTGVAPRDVTPEAVRSVIEKEIPGCGELMRMEGLKATPLASLSRSLAGTLGSTLIIALPGSPKGAVESLDAIVKLVPHLVDLLHGRTGH
jgi:molybdenum cofactor synthesis domain-containing protein